MRLLLVEDDRNLLLWLGRALKHGGYAVDTIDDGLQACQMFSNEDYDVVVLDLFLPTLDGYEVLRRVRQRGLQVPIIVLSADDEVEARIKAIELGADDFLTKPFDLAELEVRVKSLIRRCKGQGFQTFCCGALTYDRGERLFRLGDKPIHLPPKERAVMEVLVNGNGKVVRKEVIYEKIYSLDAQTTQDAIEVYVHRLRRRFSDFGVSILTFRGLGYMLETAKPRANA